MASNSIVKNVCSRRSFTKWQFLPKFGLMFYFLLILASCEHDKKNKKIDDSPLPPPIESEFSSVSVGKDGIALPLGIENDKIGAVKHSFSIAKKELTFGIWYDVYTYAVQNGYKFANGGKAGSTGEDAVKDAQGASSPSPVPPKDEEKDLPVTMISYADAIVWCNAYSEKMGLSPVYYSSGKLVKDATDAPSFTSLVARHTKGFRLPTEFEWAYAARYLGKAYVENAIAIEQKDGSMIYFSSGASTSGNTLPAYEPSSLKKDDAILHQKLKLACDEVAVYHKYWNGSAFVETGIKEASKVATKKPNKLGLYDMSGNVWEWAYNLWSDNSGYETYRVRFGGSWKYNSKNLMLGSRFGYSQDHTDDHLGFRLALWTENIDGLEHDGKPEPTEKRPIKPEPPVQNKTPINPMYFLINNVVKDDFPEEVRNHLTDGTNPIYEVSGENASIVLEFWEDKAKSIIVNDENQAIKEKDEAGQHIFYINYICELPKGDKTKQFVIKIEPKDEEKYFSAKYIFRLKGGKPLPKLKEGRFSINGISSGRMPIEVGEHLTDGSDPLYAIPSKKADIKIVYFTDDAKDAVFKCNTNGQEVSETRAFEEKSIDGDPVYVCEYSTQISEEETSFTITVNPKSASEYSPLIYTFRLKNDGTLQSVPGIFVIINDKKYLKHEIDKKEITLPATKAEIKILCETDIIKSIAINNRTFNAQEFEDQGNHKKYFGYSHTETLKDAGTDFTVVVEPKDKLKYSNLTLSFKILPMPKDNAEFALNSSKEQEVGTYESAFKEGITKEYEEDYGFVSAIFGAKPVDERASIYLDILSLADNSSLLTKPIKLTPQTEGKYKGYHISERIDAYKDKPTRFVVYVVAADGVTKNDEKGRWEFIANYVGIKWGYEANDVKTLGYGAIEIEKSRIVDNKVYFSIGIWDEDTGSKIDTGDGYPKSQTTPIKGDAGEYGSYKQWYNLTLTINPSGANKLVLPITQNNKKAFSYEVPITLK